MHEWTQLVGRTLQFRGETMRVRDVLIPGPIVVLESSVHHEVQATAYGQAHRRVPQRMEIDVRDEAQLAEELWEAAQRD